MLRDMYGVTILDSYPVTNTNGFLGPSGQNCELAEVRAMPETLWTRIRLSLFGSQLSAPKYDVSDRITPKCSSDLQTG